MCSWRLHQSIKMSANLFLSFAFFDIITFAQEAACGNVTVNNRKKDPS